MRILLLGAYGLIGSSLARALVAANHEVLGVGRDLAKGKTLLPFISWRQADISTHLSIHEWLPYLDNIDIIINASGALQSGIQDNLDKLQHLSIKALIAAAEQKAGISFMQISALGASPDAKCEFLKTKGLADSALRSSKLNWLIFKPGLVFGANTYGGTTLLRMLASLPAGLPLCLAQSRIQTVALTDLTTAVVLAMSNQRLWGKDYDLVESGSHSLSEINEAMRLWMGGCKSSNVSVMPETICSLVGYAADVLGWFGWRSPLRSTSLMVLAGGIAGDGSCWEEASGYKLKSFSQTLSCIPATQQERIFSKISVLFPVGVFVLALFWFYSGLIGLIAIDAAARYLASPYASQIIIACSFLDIFIAGLIVFRKTIKIGLVASLSVAVVYLVGGSFMTPWLWLDPLGSLAKIVPVMMLTLFVRAGLQER